MNRFEIYKDAEGTYWLVSTYSMRYDSIKENKELQDSFDLRAHAFKWFEEKNIPSIASGFDNGYYEIYV